MDYFLNELSLTKVSDIEAAKKLMYDFIGICKALKSHGFYSLRIADSSLLVNYELCENYRVFDWRNDSNVDREFKTRFRSIITQSPLIPTDNERLIYSHSLSEFKLAGKKSNIQCIGLGLAYLAGSISISFNSDDLWKTSDVELKYLFLNEDEALINQTVNARHAALVLHLDSFSEWFQSLRNDGLLENWNPANNLFPRIDISDQLVQNNNWTNFYREAQGMSEQLRIAKFIEIGEKVAIRNGYIKDSKLTKKNNRIIFAAGYSKNRIYFALDTLHGSFEVCNYKGDSIGEYGFHGNRLGNGHNIQIEG